MKNYFKKTKHLDDDTTRSVFPFYLQTKKKQKKKNVQSFQLHSFELKVKRCKKANSRCTHNIMLQ